ncbi:MAG: histidine phosphatase family protein [Anaerolineae bacterium]
MSKYIWLIRHGESQGNLERRIQGWVDYPLTGLGRKQATRLAERLVQLTRSDPSGGAYASQGWGRHGQGEGALYELIASPLERAAETARIIGDALALPVHFDERLKEYNFGPINGLTPEEVVARFPEVQAAWRVNRPWEPLPGEEGEPAFVARVREAMDELVARMPEEANAAVVAHGGSIDACLRGWLGIDHRNGRRVFAFDNASLSLVRVRANSYRILLLNDTCHLWSTPQGKT